MKAHGVGIDGVWKVQYGDPHNGGKPFAVVESKASSNANTPKNTAAKPQVRGKLLSNARRIKKAAAAAAAAAVAAMPRTSDLLDPPTGAGSNPSGPTPAAGRPNGSPASRRGQRGKQSGQQPPASSSGSSAPTPTGAETPLVQMSHDWITKNIGTAVKNPAIEYEIRRKGGHVYSRHLFYTPFYLPSAVQHVEAVRAEVGSLAKRHAYHESHEIPTTHRHDEQEVKMAVNAKHRLLKQPLEP